MGETWRGFYPITAFVRDALRKASGSGLPVSLSQDEQTLLTVCEFWRAVNSGTLVEELAIDAINQLMCAQEAFAGLGAIRIASTLRVAVAQLARAHSPERFQSIVAHTEEELSRTEDSVDALIARFALEHMALDPAAQKPER